MRRGFSFVWCVVCASILFLSSCKQDFVEFVEDFDIKTPHQNDSIKELIPPVEPEIKTVDYWKGVDKVEVEKSIVKSLVRKKKSIEIEGLPLFSSKLISKFYRLNKNKLIWNTSKKIENAYKVLDKAYLDGLQTSDYHEVELKSLSEQIAATQSEVEKADLLAMHDIVLTDAILLYSFHLLIGKIDPYSLDENWNYKNETISKKIVKQFIKQVKAGKVLQAVDHLRPKKIEYKAMMNAMRYYQSIKDDTWTQIKIDDKIELGDTNTVIPLIRERLSLCCEWNEYVQDSTVYDSSLYHGIVDFQNSHGLLTDGVIGQGTIDMLNTTPKERIEKLKVNLERLRWLSDEEKEYVVDVNIAAFRLNVLHKGKRIHQTRVMTGKVYHKTPIFTKRMEYIDFNPTWTVPYSIATRELLPRLKKEGAGYLSARNMVLLNQKGKVLDASAIDYSSLSSRNFPYIIRQEPGSKNALGEVKFMFPNKYSVYLHDTQSKSLFSRSSRAFSHGCIRVEHPLDLAAVLLKDKKKWNRKKIDEVIASRTLTRVKLKKNIQVMILYYTAGLDADGTFYYLPDVYKRDAKLLAALEAPFEYDENTFLRVYPENTYQELDSLEVD